ncbi:MAG: ATP-grasp domain-containing protein [Proteobacteria bacterium]|nr:ATP-grasp domain-containing protein [Pseudomonadota bacterium]
MTRLLIANRGEIAVRIARSARRLGIVPIAVYSDVDRDSPHIGACDEAVAIGGTAPADSYLSIERILAAARRARSDAVHPGYGFLAENATFAAAVADAGLQFVGPSAAAIQAMADKARARRQMAAAGLPVVPGYDDETQDAAALAAAAARVGYPIMIKAAAGGGGRGMRRVAEPAELGAALASAAAEARAAFGDGRVVLERALDAPRHVEIQVLADRHGGRVHLGERDCSIQRRHQKVIEESPSPAVDAALRVRMGNAALEVARAVNYCGAGTVEFLLQPDGAFYFIEMNTRLQVEHPVTELVTGLDLVEWQLRIARGEPLGFSQSDLRFDGHAIEVRLCAEEPADGFLARTGTVLDWRADASARCDHALERGLRIGAHFDSMLAKIAAHGSTRDEAIARLARAIDRTVLLGVTSNRGFLGHVLRHPAFIAGDDVSTAFIERHFPTGATRAVRPSRHDWALAAWLSAAAAPEAADVTPAWRHWSIGPPLPLPVSLEWRAPESVRECAAQRGTVRLRADGATVTLAGATVALSGRPVEPRCDGEAEVDGEPLPYRYAWQDTHLWLHTRDGDFEFRCRRREPALEAAAPGTAADIRSAISGRVIAVEVAPGVAVVSGQRLLVLEAMKMEHEVRAGGPGVVARVEVATGSQVTPGQVLVRFGQGVP